MAEAARISDPKVKGWGQSWLITIVAAYVLMVAWYFLLSQTEALKYVITIGGILLGTVFREAVPKEWKVLRVLAIAIPAVVVAGVQAQESYKASKKRQSQELEDSRARARDIEAKLRELLVLEPRDTIDAIRNADRGFLAKADLLAYRATLKDDRNPEDSARLSRLQASYRAAAADFTKVVKPQYEGMLALKERDPEDRKKFSLRLRAVTENVAELAGAHRNAGFYNHAGALAQAAKDGERALAYFYQALALEPDHLPAYESLGYALWIFNLDAHGALNAAARGLMECERQRNQIGVRKDAGAYGSLLEKMEANLKLQYAYFSAIQFANEKQARQYAGAEYAAHPGDAEVQDTWGYVKLRFAKSAQELEEAMALFRKAIDNPAAERITTHLARAHLQQANDALVALKGR